MMTSSNGNIFRVTGPLWGESTGHRRFPSRRPVTQSFDIFGIFFDLRLNKRQRKQSRHRWFETPSRLLWRHYNESLNTMPILFSVATVDLFPLMSAFILRHSACGQIHGAVSSRYRHVQFDTPHAEHYITMTSWARWRLKLPESPLFAQLLVQM